MARPPIDWKSRCIDAEKRMVNLSRDKASLERALILKSEQYDIFKEKAEKFEKQSIKYQGVIEYLEDHIHLLNETIEKLRGKNNVSA